MSIGFAQRGTQGPSRETRAQAVLAKATFAMIDRSCIDKVVDESRTGAGARDR
jgi:hypothetical protein